MRADSLTTLLLTLIYNGPLYIDIVSHGAT